VALLSVIRRWHLRDKVSIREIARRTKLSRNTIAKYLASGETSPHYPRRKSPSQLDPYAAELAGWLRSNQ
jgi:transposase